MGRAMLFSLENQEERVKMLREKKKDTNKDDDDDVDDEEEDKKDSYFLKAIIWFSHDIEGPTHTWIKAGKMITQYFEDKVKYRLLKQFFSFPFS